jgi:predicted phage terminase large subunit-like protein
MLVGGSRSGKTFIFTRAVGVRAIRAPNSRHCIFRLRFNALRASVWLDTFPKVMKACFPGVDYEDKRQDGYTLLENNAEIWWAGLDEKERVEKILGMEFATLYFNESSQIPYQSVLTAQTRLAQSIPGLVNKAFYDLNPIGTAHWSHRLFLEHVDPITRLPLKNPDQYKHLFINPVDNRANIDPAYIESLEAMPERQRRRFLDGKYVAEIDGALWTWEILERQRIDKSALPVMKRIVVAVDPSGASGEEDERSDEIGIVVCGLGIDGFGYVLEDASGRMSPEQWGALAVRLYRKYGAERIIAEKNFGGDMVRAVIQGCDRNAPVKLITASRGKVQRAEPVSSLYEQGKVFHCGTFSEMEEQMTNFSTAGYLGDRSPDRCDAAVWGLTELMIGVNNGAYLEFMRKQLELDAQDAHA